jgi:hypothetical protein
MFKENMIFLQVSMQAKFRPTGAPCTIEAWIGMSEKVPESKTQIS